MLNDPLIRTKLQYIDENNSSDDVVNYMVKVINSSFIDGKDARAQVKTFEGNFTTVHSDITDLGNQFSFGLFTPTITSYNASVYTTVNLTAQPSRYFRYKNYVEVSGEIVGNNTAPGIALIGLSKPFIGNIINPLDLSGIASMSGANATQIPSVGIIRGDVSTEEARITIAIFAPGTSTDIITYKYSYLIVV
jgi:hypothetical protein